MLTVIGHANAPGLRVDDTETIEQMVQRGLITAEPCRWSDCADKQQHWHYFATKEGRDALAYTQLARQSP